MRVVENTRSRSSGISFVLDEGMPGKRVVDVTCALGIYDGRRYCVIYDHHMNILVAPSLFMTVDMSFDSENTRSQALSAIKLLCIFEIITGLDFSSFDLSTARAFLQFVRGTLADGVGCTFELRTVRSEATVAAYLKTMRRYASFLDIDDSPFLLDSKRLKRGCMTAEANRGKLLAAKAVDSFEAPHYITIDQYRAILQVIDSGWSVEERAICRLMFEHGLRIGEVLGLTIEDLESSIWEDGMLHYAVLLRNRACDKPWQKAKTAIAVTSAASYGSTDYRKRNVGYQRVYLSESVYMDIMSYVEASRSSSGFDPASCVADAVDGGENQYLFCNTLGRPLTSNLWNKRLRAVMAGAGVPVDSDSRKTNLNHRFRHGYAMFLTRQCGKGAFEVKTLLRHRNMKSTEVYHRPTEEDIRELQGTVISELEGLLLGGGDV